MTRDAEALVEGLGPLIAQIDERIEVFTGESDVVRGAVTIGGPDVFCRMWLLPRIAAAAKAYGELSLDVRFAKNDQGREDPRVGRDRLRHLGGRARVARRRGRPHLPRGARRRRLAGRTSRVTASPRRRRSSRLTGSCCSIRPRACKTSGSGRSSDRRRRSAARWCAPCGTSTRSSISPRPTWASASCRTTWPTPRWRRASSWSSRWAKRSPKAAGARRTSSTSRGERATERRRASARSESSSSKAPSRLRNPRFFRADGVLGVHQGRRAALAPGRTRGRRPQSSPTTR
jgi:hypothetical protein